MCLAIYVGSTIELPTIPWGDTPSFNVEKLAKVPRAVARHLDTPHVYSVGAHTACACGFIADGENDVDRAKRVESIEAFTAWLRTAVEHDPVLAVVCWMGDEAKKPERRTISVDKIPEFDFDRAWDTPILLRIRA